MHRLLSGYDVDGSIPVQVWSPSEKRAYKLAKSGNYMKTLSREPSGKDHLRFGVGFHFFSAKARSLIAEIVPAIQSFPVTLTYRGESSTYFLIEGPGKSVRLETKESTGYYDLDGFYVNPEDLIGVDIATVQNSNEILVSERLKGALETAQITGASFKEMELTNLDSNGDPFSCHEMTYTNNSKYLWIKPEFNEDIEKDGGRWTIKERANFIRYSGTTFADLVCSTLAMTFYSEALIKLLTSFAAQRFVTKEITVSYGGVTRPYYQIVPQTFVEPSDHPSPGANIEIRYDQFSRYFRVHSGVEHFPIGLSGTWHLVLSNREKDQIESAGLSNIAFKKFRFVNAGDA